MIINHILKVKTIKDSWHLRSRSQYIGDIFIIKYAIK